MADEKEKVEAEESPVAWVPDKPLWKGSLSADKPVVQPDGHESLSQEDIDNRG